MIYFFLLDYDVLTEHSYKNTFNTKMIPPVSREGVTLLDPDVVQNYFTEYNNQLDILDNVDEIANPEKYIAVNKTFTILKKEFGCV